MKVRPNGNHLFYSPSMKKYGVHAANGAPRTVSRAAYVVHFGVLE